MIILCVYEYAYACIMYIYVVLLSTMLMLVVAAGLILSSHWQVSCDVLLTSDRASIEPNFHDLYLKFLDKVNSKALNKEIVQATYENCKVFVYIDLNIAFKFIYQNTEIMFGVWMLF